MTPNTFVPYGTLIYIQSKAISVISVPTWLEAPLKEKIKAKASNCLELGN